MRRVASCVAKAVGVRLVATTDAGNAEPPANVDSPMVNKMLPGPRGNISLRDLERAIEKMVPASQEDADQFRALFSGEPGGVYGPSVDGTALDLVEAESTTADGEPHYPSPIVGPNRNVGATEAAYDNSADYFLRKQMLLLYKNYPVDFFISTATATVTSINIPGKDPVRIPRDMQHPMPLFDAIALAKEHGLQLVQRSVVAVKGDTSNMMAVCVIEDYAAWAGEYIRFWAKRRSHHPQGGVKELKEVGFTGGIDEWALKWKMRDVSDFLFHRHPVRLSLRKFGTAKIGFAVLDDILKRATKRCNEDKAYFAAGKIQAGYDEIFLFLHPTNARLHLDSVVPLSDEELAQAKAKRMEEEEEEIHAFVQELPGPYERVRYERMIAEGTAWTYRDPGLSLRKQRREKAFSGWLPKGNHKIYTDRADVELPAPHKFNAVGASAVINGPRESNIEQAERAATVLDRRAQMSVTEAHDGQHTEDNPMLLDRLHYSMRGDAIRLGDFKHSVGIKRRKRAPRAAAGFAQYSANGQPMDE